MHRLKSILLVSALLCSMSSFAQVEVIADHRLDLRMGQRIASVDSTSLSGYRIQIFFGTNRNDAQLQQAKFMSLYPEWSRESYVLYFDPNWRVRVGNFYRKIDAQPMMVELQRDFGGVFLIPDKIELPGLR